MKTQDDLNVFYHETLLPLLANLESERAILMRKVHWWTAGAGAIGLVLLFLLLPLAGYFSRGPIMLFLAYAAIPTYISHSLNKKYRRAFKHQIIRKLIHFIKPGLSYHPEQTINRATLIESGLFPSSLKEHWGDDLIKGKIDKTFIEFSEVHLRFDDTFYDTLTNIQKYEFDGLFISADFNKHFSGKTFIIPCHNKAQSKIKKKIAQADPTIEYIELENPTFSKTFDVYSNSQIESRYILTSNLMERLYDFKEKTKSDIYISFVNSRVNIAISIQKPLFEPKYTESNHRFKPIQEYFNDLQLAIGVVKDLNLNTRIWTKE